jgi:hypothetical protein
MKYLNFNLEAFEYRKENSTERFRVRVSNSPAGEQKLGDSETVALPPTLRPGLHSLDKRLLTLKEMIALGEDLGAALFPPRVRSLLSNSRARLADGEGLRIRLMLDTYALADLPWEFVYLADPDTPANQKGAEGFLVLDRRLSLVRHQVLGQPIGKLDPVADGGLRLVAVLSNPKGTDELDLTVEQRNIEKAIKQVSSIQPEFYLNATIDVLLEAMIKGAHIFHFSGHGSFEGQMESPYGSQEGEGFLALTGEDGEEVAFSAQKLALSLAGRGVRFAMLGACESSKVDQVNAWTGVASALTRAGIPAVVGMQFSVFDDNAIAFSKSFYLGLAAGQAIDEAVTEGRLAIFARSDNDERDWAVPVLYLRAEEGVIFPKSPVPEVSGTPVPHGPGPGPKPAGQKEGEVDKRTLREAMVQFFDMGELAALCLDVQEALKDAGIDLEVNLDMVGGEGKRTKVLNLIEYLSRRGYLPYLVSAVRNARAGII